jgi:ubiquinone/menaquinone biosynthesis C-methylase UbiE
VKDAGPPDHKVAVKEFWEESSCGEIYAVGDTRRAQFDEQAAVRYALEPYIFDFADFPSAAGKDVLEIGVGMGADHLEWAKAGPRSLTGIDLTQRAVDNTTERLGIYGLTSTVRTADAEQLPFADGAFDVVYSWGVLHHSPDTPRAIGEVHRVLRPGGRAVVMVYHRRSIVGFLLWVRYALLTGHPGRSLETIYDQYLESPGTKAYTEQQARELFRAFATVKTDIRLSVGDTMEGAAGQRHPGPLLTLARSLWPRAIIKRFLPGYGLFLIVTATK